jgi:hypothetical protein
MVELAWLPAATRWACELPALLTLRAWLEAPVAWDSHHGIKCEGALQYAVVSLESGQTPDDAFFEVPREQVVEIPIPIEDTEMVGMKIAMASWAQPSPDAAETIRYRRKRARAEEYGTNQVRISGGPYKSLNIAVPTLTCAWLDFHVIGDKAKLYDLLPHVAHIGRNRSSGLGHVLGWEILDDPERRAILDRGRLMRTLPVGCDVVPRPGTFTVRNATTRAPYHHPRSLCEAMVPIVRLP